MVEGVQQGPVLVGTFFTGSFFNSKPFPSQTVKKRQPSR